MAYKTTNPVTRAFHRYNVELALSLFAYCATMAASRNALEGPLRHSSDTVQLLVAISPVIPVAFMFAAVVRLILRTDELLRRLFVDSLAIAGGVTALLAVTYGLIESDRFPHLSAWWTWTTYGVAWIIATFVVRRRYRR